jgi:predicted enzyme related to lactoylglutathione lyase
MSERNGFAHGVPCWVDTWQPDAEAAMSFYTELFGWEAEDTMPEGVEGTHYMCRLRGRDVAAIASRPEGAPPVTAWTTYVWVDDVDATVAKAIEGGGNVLAPRSGSGHRASTRGPSSSTSPAPMR